MSFTGIFRAKDGLAAIVDSKASRWENGQLVEDSQRQPEKLFPFPNGVAVTYGANQLLVQNSYRLFSQKILVEDLVFEYLQRNQQLDHGFFQDLLIKMGSNPANKEPVHFLIGRKIRPGEYRLEQYQVGYNCYAERVAAPSDHYFIGGDDLYRILFERISYSPYLSSVDKLQQFAATTLMETIDFMDRTLSYNPVGGTVKSFIVR